MLKLKKNIYNLNNSSELEIFLSTGMEIFTSKNNQKQSRNKKIKNQIKDEKSNTDEKIDELIANYEKTVKNNKNSGEKQKDNKKPYLEFVEIRKSFEKNPQISNLDTETTIFKDKTLKKPNTNTKEITFNITEDDSKTKELTFNISKNDDQIQKFEKKNNKENKKRFFIFKSKKGKKDFNKKTEEKIKSNDKKTSDKLKTHDKTKKSKDKKTAFSEEIIEKENPFFDEDIKKVLLITDNLLEKLPEDVINEFIKSKDFELYERIINKIKWFLWVY